MIPSSKLMMCKTIVYNRIRALLAALLFHSSSSITVDLYASAQGSCASTCTCSSNALFITAYVDSCAPEGGPQIGFSYPNAWAIQSTTPATGTPSSATILGFQGTTCSSQAAVSFTVTTSSCQFILASDTYGNIYGQLSALDKVRNAQSGNVAAYKQVYLDRQSCLNGVYTFCILDRIITCKKSKSVLEKYYFTDPIRLPFISYHLICYSCALYLYRYFNLPARHRSQWSG
jgi:hypothetical protein